MISWNFWLRKACLQNPLRVSMLYVVQASRYSGQPILLLVWIFSPQNFHDEFVDEKGPDYKAELEKFYRAQFAREYREHNGGLEPSENDYIQGLDAASTVIQYQYLIVNPHPLGKKEQWADPEDDTLYGQIHSLYHPKFREFRQKFGYYDIFLIAPESGTVVYSVAKEADFGTSLFTGPYLFSNGRCVGDVLADRTFAPHCLSRE